MPSSHGTTSTAPSKATTTTSTISVATSEATTTSAVSKASTTASTIAATTTKSTTASASSKASSAVSTSVVITTSGASWFGLLTFVAVVSPGKVGVATVDDGALPVTRAGRKICLLTSAISASAAATPTTASSIASGWWSLDHGHLNFDGVSIEIFS